MILMMDEYPENKNAVNSLKNLTKEGVVTAQQLNQHLKNLNCGDKRLILVDVSKKDNFLRYYNEENFANELLKYQLPHTIQEVVFLISDNNNKKNLREFARPFLACLEKAFSHSVTAYVPTDFNYDSTLLIPPQKTGGQWEVIGQNTSGHSKHFFFNWFKSEENKTPIWQGADIINWMITEQKSVRSTPDIPEEAVFNL